MASVDVDAEAGVERPARPWRTTIAVATGVLAIDQATKWWALQTLDGGRIVELVGSLQLNLVFNTGGAFGLGSRYSPLIALAVVAVMLVLMRTSRSLLGRWPRLAVAVVLGGALGNLVDRLFRSGDGLLGGGVVDFIDLQWWPVFNVADSAITVGAIVLALTAGREPAATESPRVPEVGSPEPDAGGETG